MASNTVSRAVREAAETTVRRLVGGGQAGSRARKAAHPVGFMRRFDHEYVALKAMLGLGRAGTPAGNALRAPQSRGAPSFDKRDDRA